ncbi:HTH-type transcriptional repressor YtrA [Corynebacterium glaucum]|uniref:GntR family transcriptional regulator n=1 Tax=Corynebacterium glaucum TaxID=187491 RepID=UPI0025B5E5BC|nr:GntR family transcriptional regulator [Corynebacterium glaucum]WJZ08196.1 HTH-type transcriptional repressor YtrA [Corynebacterium glaucum]
MHVITISPDASVPVFQQIHDAIVHAIATGELRTGDYLDSVRRVAKEFGINPATVQKAYDLLRQEGLIESASRSGSRIAAPPAQEPDIGSLRPALALAVAQGTAPKELKTLLDDELGRFIERMR